MLPAYQNFDSRWYAHESVRVRCVKLQAISDPFSKTYQWYRVTHIQDVLTGTFWGAAP